MEAYQPLAQEFARLKSEQQIDLLGCEKLFEDPIRGDVVPDAGDTIYHEVYYERYGKKMVAAGDYQQVLTLENHYRPFVSRLVRDCFQVPA